MVLRMQLAGGDQPDEAVSTAELKPAAHSLAWLCAPKKGNKGEMPGSRPTLDLLANYYGSGSGDADSEWP